MQAVGRSDHRPVIYSSEAVGHCIVGSLRSLDWNGAMEWRNGIVECVVQGERSLLMQFAL